MEVTAATAEVGTRRRRQLKERVFSVKRSIHNCYFSLPQSIERCNSHFFSKVRLPEVCQKLYKNTNIYTSTIKLIKKYFYSKPS